MTKMTIKLNDEEQQQVVRLCEANHLTRKQVFIAGLEALTAKKAEVPPSEQMGDNVHRMHG